MLSIFAIVQQAEGLTLGELLRDIPHDAPAIVVYLLVGAFVYAIWRANRPKSGKPQAGDR